MSLGRPFVFLAVGRLRPDLEREAVEELAGLVGLEDRRFPLLDDVLGGADGSGRVGRYP
jgi:hypothetical protein